MYFYKNYNIIMNVSTSNNNMSHNLCQINHDLLVGI